MPSLPESPKHFQFINWEENKSQEWPRAESPFASSSTTVTCGKPPRNIDALFHPLTSQQGDGIRSNSNSQDSFTTSDFESQNVSESVSVDDGQREVLVHEVSFLIKHII
jgi:hypothetical protein